MNTKKVYPAELSNFFTFEYVEDKTKAHGKRRTTTINWEYIYSIPEFTELKTLHQSPKWHSESEYVSGHVEKVVDYAVNFLDLEYNLGCDERDHSILLLAAIFHDVGKCRTTFFKESDQMWHHYNHEVESEKITRRILWNFGVDVREKVCALVRWHMEPFNIMRSKDPVKKIIDLSMIVPSITMLYKLKMFDMYGSMAQDSAITENDQYVLDKFMDLATVLDCDNHISYVNFVLNSYNHVMSKKNKLNVYLYIGLPGAGKDTLISKTKYNNCAVVCRDDIRATLGLCKPGEKYLGTADEENRVTDVFNKQLLDAANEGKTIVINNMNNKRKYRDAYKEMLKNYDVTWNYIYVEADSLQKNIERRKGQISEDAFYNMIESFEYPTADEYDVLKVKKS